MLVFFPFTSWVYHSGQESPKLFTEIFPVDTNADVYDISMLAKILNPLHGETLLSVHIMNSSTSLK